jgi:hypothetical protein
MKIGIPSVKLTSNTTAAAIAHLRIPINPMSIKTFLNRFDSVFVNSFLFDPSFDAVIEDFQNSCLISSPVGEVVDIQIFFSYFSLSPFDISSSHSFI